MRLGKNAAGRTATSDGAKSDLISKLELTIAAAVDAIENLLRTQLVLLRGGSGEFARHVGRSGRNFAGPYSSLLFSIVLYVAMSMWLYAWLDQIQHVEYEQRRSITESLPNLSWTANLGVILSMFVSVPIVGSAFSFVLARSSPPVKRAAIRDMYVFAISCYIWHLGFLVAPTFTWALLRMQAWENTPHHPLGLPDPGGVVVFSDAEMIGMALIIVLITLRAAWIFESNVNRILPRTMGKRVKIYFFACFMMCISVAFLIRPISKQYFEPAERLSVQGSASLVGASMIDLDLVFTNEREKPVAIKSGDVSFQLWDRTGKRWSVYRVHFYGADDKEFTYVVLEPGRPTVVAATVYFEDASPQGGVWPFNSDELADMAAEICVVSRMARLGDTRVTECKPRQIQGPPRPPMGTQ